MDAGGAVTDVELMGAAPPPSVQEASNTAITAQTAAIGR
jgi:hypothetical protein